MFRIYNAKTRLRQMRENVQFNLILSFLVLSSYFATVDAASFGRSKEVEAERLAAERAAEAERAEQYITIPILGIELDKQIFRNSIVVLYVLSKVISYILAKKNKKSKRTGNRKYKTQGCLDVVLIGSGLPKKGMVSVHIFQN